MEKGLGIMEENMTENLVEFLNHSDLAFDAVNQMRFPLPDWEKQGMEYPPLKQYLNANIAMKAEMLKLEKLVEDKPAHSFYNELRSMKNLSVQSRESFLLTILGAGIDTIVKTLTSLLYVLSIHPEIQQKIRTEMSLEGNQIENLKYLRNVIKELLRLYPTSPLIPRILDDEMILNGFSLPPDTTIFVSNWFMGRDPRIYENPEQFDPNRKIIPYSSLTFGLGARMCPGRRLAEMQLAYSVAHILQNFKLEYKGETHPKPKTRALMGLDIPIKIKFEKIE